MKNLNTRMRAAPFLILAVGACGQVAETNQHLANMDQTTVEMVSEIKKSNRELSVAAEQSKRLADSLESMNQQFLEMSQILMQFFAPKETKKTDDLDEVLRGATSK